MAGWAGFTDEDLRQIKQSSSHDSPVQQSRGLAHKQAMMKKQKQQQQRDLLARQRSQEFAQGGGSNLPASQRLTPVSPQKPQHPAEHGGETDKTDVKERTPPDAGGVVTQIQNTAGSGKPGGEQGQNSVGRDAGENGPAVDEVKELDEKEALNLELSRVEQFRRQQQKMEEENKQRRQLLADAIKQRSRMAKAEAEKLTKVQKELNHLDSLVTADVAIIRDRIEAASMDFLQAQKRYERAEKEFVEAKLALAEKSDVKESLTEHLYTIIQQNEARKAERLASLMKELGLAADNCPAAPTLPPLLSFSPINTFHRPTFPPTSPTSPQSAASPHGDSGHSLSTPEGSSASVENTDKASSSQTDTENVVPQTAEEAKSQEKPSGEQASDTREITVTDASDKQETTVSDSGEKDLSSAAQPAAIGAVEQRKGAEDAACSSVNHESQDGGADVRQQGS
ncbi:hypothetical protein BaRGS_00015964 [Batillaria attramentaria]|uniref:RAB6-interacting golgin n=1 Tax=Batillaria attramentaria TaxID=370345 RepID=A0ABD0L0D8_9CAEN